MEDKVEWKGCRQEREFCMQRANEDIEEGTGKGGVG